MNAWLYWLFGDTRHSSFPWSYVWSAIIWGIPDSERSAVWSDHTNAHNAMQTIWSRINDQLRDDIDNLIDI